MSFKTKKDTSYLYRILIISIFFMLITSLSAAWLTDIPKRLTQPNGVQIAAFSSGDEFFSWVHDENHFTMVKDDLSGFWCWAQEENGELVSSGYPVHLYNPESRGIRPHARISAGLYRHQ